MMTEMLALNYRKKNSLKVLFLDPIMSTVLLWDGNTLFLNLLLVYMKS